MRRVIAIVLGVVVAASASRADAAGGDGAAPLVDTSGIVATENDPSQPLVRFEPTGSQRYVLEVTRGSWSGTCAMPCTLRVPAGRAHVEVTGDGRIREDLVIPSAPAARVRLGHPDRVASIVGGSISLGVTAPILLTLGIAFALSPGAFTTSAVLFSALGVAATVGGVAAIVAGATARPTVDVRTIARRDGHPRWAPVLALTSGGASLGAVVAF